MVEFAAKLTGRPSASNFHPPLPLVTYFPVWLQRQRNFGDSHVSLRLISSNDDRVLSIRDHLLLLVRQDGELEVQRGLVRMVTWEQAPWVIHHWTPFNELHAGEASSPGYRHAVERQHSTPDLPYGLEVWHGVKVLSVLWADDGRFDVPSFVRGPWEDLALAL